MPIVLRTSIQVTSQRSTGLCTHCTRAHALLKFIYSVKATKFCEISTLLLSYVKPVKSKVDISQTFMASSEYMNFMYCGCKMVIFSRVLPANELSRAFIYFPSKWFSLSELVQVSTDTCISSIEKNARWSIPPAQFLDLLPCLPSSK